MSKRHAYGRETSTLASYLRQIARLPRLSVDEERALGHRIRHHRDDDALSQLVEGNLRFVVSYAKRYHASGIPTLDLNADDTAYEEIHHKAADTMDRVDARNLAIGAAAVAATAYAIADAPRPIAAHRRPPTKGMD